MTELIADADKWYDTYDALETKETQRDFLLETLQHKLSEDFIEKSGAYEMMTEFVDDLFIENNDHYQVLPFLKKMETLQPELYKNKLQYLEYYIVDYHLFHGTPEGINDVVKFYSENPNQDIDMMLRFYEKIRYWELNDIAVEIAEKVYKPIREYAGYYGTPELDFAVTIYCAEIQKAYENFLKTGALNMEEARVRAKDFDMEDTACLTFENSVNQRLNTEHLWQSSTDKTDYGWGLRMYFLQYAHSKGLSFIAAGMIWEEMGGFWYETGGEKTTSPDQFFELTYHAFDEFLANKRFIFSPMVLKICTTLWGVPFIYDFLHEKEVISTKLYEKAQITIDALKSTVIKAFYNRLWECSYIHRVWPKPDSIPAEVYDAEKIIFEASYGFKENYNAFKSTHEAAFSILPKHIIPRIGERKRQNYKKKERSKRNPENDAARKLRKKQKKKAKKKRR